MDHASAKRRDLLERGIHVRDGEVGQRGRISWAAATFVNAERRSPALGLPASTLGFAALDELDAKQARPEPARAVGIVSRELDQPKQCVHAADDSRARAVTRDALSAGATWQPAVA